MILLSLDKYQWPIDEIHTFENLIEFDSMLSKKIRKHLEPTFLQR